MTWVVGTTYLLIHIPAVLPGLLELAEDTLRRLAHYPWISCRPSSQRGKHLWHPLGRRRCIREGLHQRTQSQHSRMSLCNLAMDVDRSFCARQLTLALGHRVGLELILEPRL